MSSVSNNDSFQSRSIITLQRGNKGFPKTYKALYLEAVTEVNRTMVRILKKSDLILTRGRTYREVFNIAMDLYSSRLSLG